MADELTERDLDLCNAGLTNELIHINRFIREVVGPKIDFHDINSESYGEDKDILKAFMRRRSEIRAALTRVQALLAEKISARKIFPKYTEPLPKPGDRVYLPSDDDILGGLFTVLRVKEGISAGDPTHYVIPREIPGHSYNWEFLSAKQAHLKDVYRTNSGRIRRY